MLFYGLPLRHLPVGCIFICFNSDSYCNACCIVIPAILCILSFVQYIFRSFTGCPGLCCNSCRQSYLVYSEQCYCCINFRCLGYPVTLVPLMYLPVKIYFLGVCTIYPPIYFLIQVEHKIVSVLHLYIYQANLQRTTLDLFALYNKNIRHP